MRLGLCVLKRLLVYHWHHSTHTFTFVRLDEHKDIATWPTAVRLHSPQRKKGGEGEWHIARSHQKETLHNFYEQFLDTTVVLQSPACRPNNPEGIRPRHKYAQTLIQPLGGPCPDWARLSSPDLVCIRTGTLQSLACYSIITYYTSICTLWLVIVVSCRFTFDKSAVYV